MLTTSLQQINKLNKLQGSFEASFFKARPGQSAGQSQDELDRPISWYPTGHGSADSLAAQDKLSTSPFKTASIFDWDGRIPT